MPKQSLRTKLLTGNKVKISGFSTFNKAFTYAKKKKYKAEIGHNLKDNYFIKF